MASGKKERLQFRFSRNDPFAGIPEYEKTQPIHVKTKEIEYQPMIQKMMFGTYNYSYGLRKKQGDYFEKLTEGIYGGKMHETVSAENDIGSLVSEPDILDHKKQIIREVKSMSTGGDLKLTDEQIAKYTFMQVSDCVFERPTIRFEIYRYGIPGIIKKYSKKPIEEMVAALSENIRSMISLPFSVIFAVYRMQGKCTTRYEGNKWDTLTKLTSSGINYLLAEPEKTLAQLGLNIDDYILDRRKFPKTITIDGIKIKQFPVLRIYEKDCRKWIKTFKEQIEKERNMHQDDISIDYFYSMFNAISKKEEVPF